MATTNVGTIQLVTTIDTSDYKRGAKEIDNTNKDIERSTDHSTSNVSKAWSVASKAIVVGATAAGAGLVALGVASIKSTAQLEQSLGGSEVVFGDFSDKIQKLAKESATVMGTSQREYLDTANKMASLFQGSGLSVEKSFDLTTSAMQRATDVATAMGISTEMALESIAGAAKGNFTMMDNLGVKMNATSIEAYALSKGIDKTYDSMTEAEKVGLAMQQFMEVTTKYAGNYAKENDTLSGSFQTLKGAWGNFLSGVEGSDKQLVQAGANMAKVLGRELPKIMDSLKNGIVGIYNEARNSSPEFRKFSDVVVDTFKTIRGVIETSIQVFKNLLPIIITVTAAFVGYRAAVLIASAATSIHSALILAMGTRYLVMNGAIIAVKGAVTAATVAQAAWNAVMLLNPIGLLVGAIAGLVAIFAIVQGSANGASSAQERLNKATADGKVFTDNLKKAETEVTDARLARTGSDIAVQRAEERLNELKMGGTASALDLKEAEYNLAVAKDIAKDAALREEEAVKNAAKAKDDDANNKDKIIKAQNDVAAATNNSARQYQILADTAKNAKKAQDEIAKKGGNSTPSQQLNSAGIPSMNVPGRAMGGSVSANSPYFVGENKDGSLNSTSELFVPRSAGQIINSTDLQQALGGGGTEYNIQNINISNEVDGERWLRRLTGNTETESHGLVPRQQYMGNA